ncbi:MAG: A24 family peptidase [Chloroflexota bacterium]
MMIPISLSLGWFSGWLINYLADVLPATRKFSQPNCHSCHQSYAWLDYLFLGPCKSCAAKRSLRTLIVQFFMTIAALLLWVFPQPGFPFWLAFLILTYLTLVAVIDIEHRLVLHQVSLTGAVLGFGAGFTLHGLVPTLIGGAVGFGIMLLLYLLGEVYIRRKAKKTGIPTDEVALGFGDVNLSGVLGLILGWPAIIAGLMFAILAGGLVSLGIILWMLIRKQYQPFAAIPYAPFLILGAAYLLFL